jgi:hypothetical protein
MLDAREDDAQRAPIRFEECALMSALEAGLPRPDAGARSREASLERH